MGTENRPVNDQEIIEALIKAQNGQNINEYLTNLLQDQKKPITRREFLKMLVAGLTLTGMTIGTGITCSSNLRKNEKSNSTNNEKDNQWQPFKEELPDYLEEISIENLKEIAQIFQNQTPLSKCIIAENCKNISKREILTEIISTIINNTPSNETCIFGPPSKNFTPEKVKEILKAYNSPALEESIEIWIKIPSKYGIKPEFVIAVFIQESQAGAASLWIGKKPNGQTNKNIGNIRCTSDWLQKGNKCYLGFREYNTWEEAIEDFCTLMWIYALGHLAGYPPLTTIEKIIPVYAPKADNNNPNIYIQTVKKLINEFNK